MAASGKECRAPVEGCWLGAEGAEGTRLRAKGIANLKCVPISKTTVLVHFVRWITFRLIRIVLLVLSFGAGFGADL